MRRTGLLRIVVLLVTLFSAPAEAACRVELQTTVPVEVFHNILLVTMQVNDVDATFVVDTGAYRTLMSEDAVRNLGVARDPWVATTVRGIGGVQERPDALPRTLRLGGVTLHRKTLRGDNSVLVGPLPVTPAGRPIAGMLGRDFLSPFDLDIDLPDGHLTLFDVRGCGPGFLPWTTPYAAIPATMPIDTALVVQVAVDGKPLRALIDTGASGSLITAPGMFRLGLTPESLSHDPSGNTRGVGPGMVPVHRHRFAELRIGPDVTRDPTLWVVSASVVPIVDMLLGVDWLQTRRVWLSFATKQICIAAPQPG